MDETLRLLLEINRRRRELGDRLLEEMEALMRPALPPEPVPTRYVGVATFKAYTPRGPR